MLQSFAQSQDWLYSEPLLFDEEFCQILMKDLQSLPTPPQSPPMKAGVSGGAKPLSSGDQLSFVSDILLEDHDMQLNWNCAFIHDKEGGGRSGGGGGQPRSPSLDEDEAESMEDGLWSCLASDKSPVEKLAASVLGSSPLLSDMDTSIFEGLAGSTLDCQSLMESQETAEATSDYYSAGGDASTYSSSDSDEEEEIDVVTVGRCPSSRQLQEEEEEEEQRRALRRHNFEIQLQHNYAAPRPASPPPSSSNKRSRAHYASPSARYHHHHHASSRHPAETEDEEERRRTHNVMERQRRNELKNCFVRLRDNVPELSLNDKASKVVILKKARDCIHDLENGARRLQVRRDKLRAKQEELKARLQHLRRPVRS
ncbi:myelocytomatosis oncogene homolog [Vanacampus margaritifer]